MHVLVPYSWVALLMLQTFLRCQSKKVSCFWTDISNRAIIISGLLGAVCVALFVSGASVRVGVSCRRRLFGALFVCSRSCVVGPRSWAGSRLGVCFLGFPAVVCAVTPVPPIVSLCNTAIARSVHQRLKLALTSHVFCCESVLVSQLFCCGPVLVDQLLFLACTYRLPAAVLARCSPT